MADVDIASRQLAGLLVGDVRNPFYAQLAAAVSGALDDQGWGCLIAHCDDDPDLQDRCADEMVAAGVRGLIVTVPHGNGALMRGDVTVIAVDRPRQNVPFVSADGVEGGRLVAHHLLGAGYKRCGVVYAEPDAPAVSDRLSGFRTGFRESQADSDPGLELECEAFSHRDGFKAGLELLDRGADAVFAVNDVLAMGVMSAVGDRGLAAGTDIGVVGFDDTPFASLHLVNLTSVAQGTDEIGQNAASMLVQKVKRPDQHVPPRILRPHLAARNSTRR